MKKLSLITLIALAILVLPLTSDAVDPFTVRVIYFQPADVDAPAMPDKIRDIMKNVQEVYATELDRHGFGRKTFRMERDAQGKVVVHWVNGKQNVVHYAGDTVNTVFTDLPRQFKQKHYVYLIIMAGMPSVQNGKYGGIAATSFDGDVAFAYIADNALRNIQDIIEHELGHTFGLIHNFKQDGQSYIMGPIVGPGNDVFAKHEARWLSKSHFLNEHHIINPAPTIKSQILALENNVIQLKYEVADPDGLHHIQLNHKVDRRLMAYKFLDGNTQVVIFNFQREELANTNVSLYLMDDFGNYKINDHNFVLPEALVIEPPPKPEPTPEPEPPLAVHSRNKLMTLWAKLKRR